MAHTDQQFVWPIRIIDPYGFFPEKLRFLEVQHNEATKTMNQANTLNSYFDSTQPSNTLIHSINQNNESSRVHDKNKQKTNDIQDEEEEDEPGRRRTRGTSNDRQKKHVHQAEEEELETARERERH